MPRCALFMLMLVALCAETYVKIINPELYRLAAVCNAVLQTSEKEMLQKEQKGKGVDKDASEEILYKIDIPANRYDMLCLEGIARALNIFNQRLSKIEYKLANMQGDDWSDSRSAPSHINPESSTAALGFPHIMLRSACRRGLP